MKAPTCRVERGSVVATKAFKASSCTALKKLALPPTAKLVSPSMPRCSNNLCQPRIVSSFNKNAAAISWQLHPSSSSTKAFARRVRRDAAEPSRANAIRCLRSSARRRCEGRRRETAGRDVVSPFAFDLVAAFDAALDHRDGGELRKARGARIGALGRIPIDLMGNAVIANLETCKLS